MKRIKCPCCGFYTLECEGKMDEPLFEYCDVCGWMYDPAAHMHPYKNIGGNGISLNEAQQNYKNFGMAKVDFNFVRKPYWDEYPENNE